jgi:pyridoxamine 5'-phosphate oxidase
MSLRDRRVQYETAGLDLADLDPSPFVQWHRWYDQAAEAGVAEPNAMTVSTVDSDGLPDGRVVLARSIDDRGLVFFTNYQSAKGIQIEGHPRAAATFAWLDLHRQVRVRGSVERVSDKESDDYFTDRPRESQIGAWASPQSQVLVDRTDLDARIEDVARRFAGAAVPRPEHWGGYRIVADTFEFWQGRPSRLHDRFRYVLTAQGWTITRLAP